MLLRLPLFSLSLMALTVSTATSGGLKAEPAPYTGAAGPYELAYARNLVLDAPERPEPFVVQVTYPVSVAQSPVIVFSHGFRCELDGNDPLTGHWASHGYTVIQPRHLDAEPDSKAEAYPQEIVWGERRRDMERSLDLLDQINAAIPGLPSTLDLTTVIAAGHSYGGLTAQSAGGAKTFSRGEPNVVVFEPDARFKAVVAVSPPGRMPGFVDEQSAVSIDRPMIVTTGTEDFIPPMMPTWEVHADTYRDAVPGEKYLAVVAGADHRFGGLICGDVGTAPMPEQMATLNAATLAFIDAQVRGSETAQAYLDGLVSAGPSETMFAFETK
jgi:predicted dienelactone hydrolase